MGRLFAVFRSHGPALKRDQPLEMQPGWQTHAAFMNGLAEEGFIVVGGPLEGMEQTLLIVRAEHEAEIRQRFAADPWGEDMLTIARLAPWQLRLGETTLAGGDRS